MDISSYKFSQEDLNIIGGKLYHPFKKWHQKRQFLMENAAFFLFTKLNLYSISPSKFQVIIYVFYIIQLHICDKIT